MEACNCACDSGDNSSNQNLKEKISEISLNLAKLKKKLNLEKTLLNRRKKEVLGQDETLPEYIEFSWKRSQSIDQRTEPHITLNKAHLKDIERKCEKELERLNDYISNVSQLKKSWIQMGEAAKLDSAPNEKQGAWNVSTPRRYPKRNVFYVDNDLY